MKIQEVTIRNFVPFRYLSNISALTLKTPADIQLILGDNGCGKSSLLRELQPLPAARPDYEKNGFRQLTLEHRGSVYVLTSDFSIKSGAHSFLKDGVEHNISGITSIQEELVATHLGFTPTVRDILFAKYRMCAMSRADRKSVLLSINPVDLSYLLDKHNRVKSKIRECKNNLTLLHGRKAEIEVRLLSPDLLQLKYNDRSVLQGRVSEYSNIIYAINQHLRQIKEEHKELLAQPPKAIDLEQIKAYCHRVNRFLIDISWLDRNIDPQEQLVVHSRQEQQHATSINNIVLHLEDLTNEINTYVSHLASTSDEMSVTSLEQQITSYRSLLEQINIPENESLLSPQECHILTEIIPTICNALLIIEDQGVRRIWTNDQLTKVKQKINQLENWITTNERALGQLKQTELQYLEERKTTPVPVAHTEHCTSCDYRTGHVAQYQRLETNLATTQHQISKTTKIVEQLRRALNRLVEKTTPQLAVSQQLAIIYKALLPIRGLQLSYHTVWAEVNTRRTAYVANLKYKIHLAEKAREKQELQTKVTELVHQLRTLTDSKLPSLQFMKDLLAEKQQKHAALAKEIYQHEQHKQFHQGRIADYQNYLRIKTRLAQFTEEVQQYEKYLEVQYGIQECEHLLTVCEQLRTEDSEKLREIESVLKEQEALLARYNDEILVLITQKTQEKQDYEEIEMAISPSTGFPYKNMLDYLNRLIHNTNHIISQICTYPMKMLPYKEGDDLDYSFPIQLHNGKRPDISGCSTGQKAIINMAWTMAMILHCGLTDYPAYLDECDEGMDPLHKQRLLEWLKQLMDKRYLRQLFLIDHSAVLFSGFAASDILALREENIVVPAHKNKNAIFS